MRAAYPNKVLPDLMYKDDASEVLAALTVMQTRIVKMGGYDPSKQL